MSQNPLELLIFGLAVWRLSYMLVEEDGPFEMFNGLRWLVGTRWVFGQPGTLPTKTTWFDLHWFDKPHWVQAIVKTPYGIFDCIYCMSVWVAAAFLLLNHFSPQAAIVIELWLAGSALAIIIKEKLVP